MTSSGLIALAAALCIALSTVGPSIGQGMTASKAMDALTIYGLLIAFMLVAKI